MKQQNMLATDGKKLYVKPQINVVEIKSADIICTSGRSLNPYGGEEWGDN